ncbi:MAG: outer membrane beta-barrel protein [Algoriphagus aquaeductus]|uniref:outer membrane beta-barrel protein n=1 Tax=Algoriphagus aquaeductus TaxID=475299 RepID=UPI003878F967
MGDTVTAFGRRDFTSYPLYANQFSLSYAFVQAQYEIENKLRFRLALHTGHIVDALYVEETPSTKIIRELALYYHLNPKWAMEIGIFPSYSGAEIVLNRRITCHPLRTMAEKVLYSLGL